jgi:hypothetical protein
VSAVMLLMASAFVGGALRRLLTPKHSRKNRESCHQANESACPARSCTDTSASGGADLGLTIKTAEMPDTPAGEASWCVL